MKRFIVVLLFILLLVAIICLAIGLVVERSYNQQLLDWIEGQKGSGNVGIDVTPGHFDGAKLEDGTIIAPDELAEYYREEEK